jgi:hypothetical protein
MYEPLVTLVSYCSLEREYIVDILRNATRFSALVVVSVGTRLYSGAAEPADAEAAILADVRAAGADTTGAVGEIAFVRYEVPEVVDAPIEMHNKARQVALKEATRRMGSSSFWVLLLDGDEIPDGAAVVRWWSVARGVLQPDLAYKMANTWFFLDPRLVAEVHEDSVLLVHASQLTDEALTHPRERDGVLIVRGLRALRQVRGLDGLPMFAHMSWVRRDRAALLAKVENWGHSGDRSWAELINEALDGIAQGRWPTHDFVHNYPLIRI